MPSKVVGRNSGQLATAARAGPRELAGLAVHEFETAQPLRWRERELLADQALVDRRLMRMGRDRELDADGSQGTVEGGDAGVRFGSLQLRHGRLADGESIGEVGLGQPGTDTGLREKPSRP